MKKVFTHSGMAHLDEVFAIAAISVATGEEVEVTRGFKVEDESAYDYIVDIGGKYDGKKFFDHHQGGDEVTMKSAFGLVVDSFDALEPLRDTTFVDRVDFQDNHGPERGFEMFIGPVEKDEFFDAYEPVEQMMLAAFASGKESFAIEIAKETILHRIGIEKAFEEAEENIRKATVVNIEGLNVLLQDFELVSDAKFTSVGNRVSEKFARDNCIHLIVGKGRDPEQRSLFRTIDGERRGLNLSILEGRVPFAHKNGFFAAIDRKDSLEDIIKMLS